MHGLGPPSQHGDELLAQIAWPGGGTGDEGEDFAALLVQAQGPGRAIDWPGSMISPTATWGPWCRPDDTKGPTLLLAKADTQSHSTHWHHSPQLTRRARCPHPVAIAASIFIFAARLAGAIAASRPAQTAAMTYTTIEPTGIATVSC